MDFSRTCPWPQGFSRIDFHAFSFGLDFETDSVPSLDLVLQILGFGLEEMLYKLNIVHFNMIQL